MRQGRSLQDIAAELERQTETRQDYIAPQGVITAKAGDGSGPALVLEGLPDRTLGVTTHAHGQLSDHLGIPKKYYDRMLAEAPGLLADNINVWLKDKADEKRMVRTLDGEMRAFLSPKYRPLDNFDLAGAVLPVLQQRKVRVMSAELTETRLYIKGILPDLSDDEPIAGSQWGVGHAISDKPKLVSAIVISNSEVGAGTLRIEPSVFTTRCTNLMVLSQAAMKKYHVGRAFSADEANYEIYRDDTRKTDDAAFWLKVRDVALAAFDEKIFRAAIDQIRRAAGVKIESDALPKVVEVAVERLKLPSRTSNSILTHLARGGDLTAWGLSSAITATAESQKDLSYEEATQMERAGGEVITLGPNDWKVISEAA
jgi:hypothetical protein